MSQWFVSEAEAHTIAIGWEAHSFGFRRIPKVHVVRGELVSRTLVLTPPGMARTDRDNPGDCNVQSVVGKSSTSLARAAGVHSSSVHVICALSFFLIIITGVVCECLIIIRRVVEHRPTVLGRIRTLSIKWQGAHVNRPHRS